MYLLMDLIGQKVQHNMFGEGTIMQQVIQQEGSYISVKFLTQASLKKFKYPSCFKTFLTLLDSDAAIQTEVAIKQYEEQEQKKKQQIMEKLETQHISNKIQKIRLKSNKDDELHPFTSVA